MEKKPLPGLWNCDGVKHWNVNPDAFDVFVETKTLEWLRDAVTSLGIVASAALPQSQFVQAGPAPVVYAPVRRPSVLLIEHPGFHSEGAACVIDYLANDLSVNSAQLKIINEGATYCEVVDKAVEWFESSHGAGHRGAFGNRMPGLWQDDLLGPLMSAQKALISMQEGEADHAVWDSGGKGRPPAKRAQLMDEHVALRFRLGKWARDMAERELEWIDELVPARSHAVMVGRSQFASELTAFGSNCRSLQEVYRKAVSNYKLNGFAEAKKQPGAAMEVTQDPNALLQTLPQAVEDICLRADSGLAARPLSHKQLCICADRMATFVVMPLSKLLDECGGRPAGETVVDIRDQLVRFLPLIYIDAAPHTQGPAKDHSVFILNPYHEDGPRAWASMLASSARNFRMPEDVLASGLDDELATEDDEGVGGRGVGRPRVEETYGDEFLDFIKTYVNTRGRMSLPDGTRMADTLSSFTAPLKQIAAAATDKGFSLSPATVWRLFQPKRKNLAAPAQRGVIEARRASVELSDSQWGSRCTWSANRVKLAESWLLLASQEGIAVAQYHLDECSKFNIWTAARDRSPMGFLLLDSNGKATISNWDHSFPLARGFLISLSGVVKCDVLSGTGSHDSLPPRHMNPSQMWGFIRSHRYHPGGARSVHHDLARALQLDEQGQHAAVAMFVSDNGGSYNLDSAVNQHLYGRIFRSTRKAMVLVLAFHAGGSRFNWQVEQQWAQPRRKLAGVELGKTSVKDPHHPFHGFDDEESALRHISDHSMRDIHSVLTSCKCGGKPWHIEAPTNDEDLMADWEDVVAYYGAPKTKKDCSSHL